MDLVGVHLLMTLRCDRECSHCFVWSTPKVLDTMTISMIRKIIDQSKEISSIKFVYFEGGEPFLFYPILLEGVRYAKKNGYDVGIVTNGYWGTSGEDAVVWLDELKSLSISDLSVSDDDVHREHERDKRASNAAKAARKLGIETSVLKICAPEKGKKGDILFRGRAAEELAKKYRRQIWTKLTECPEDLLSPKRVHIDPDGNVHVCQGLIIGNINKKSLKEISRNYLPSVHPIIGPLTEGGPARLVRKYKIKHREKYADACELCYEARKKLRSRFSDALGPDTMYGIFD